MHAELKSLYRVYALNPVFGIEFSVEEKPEATERRAAARLEDNVEIVDVEDGMESLAVRDGDREKEGERKRDGCASFDCPICKMLHHGKIGELYGPHTCDSSFSSHLLPFPPLPL